MNRLSWKRRLMPLIVSQIYLWTTLALFAYGPWQWPLRDPLRFYGFVAGSHLFLALGYLSAAHRSPAASISFEKTEKLLRAALWLNLLVLPVTSYARTGNWIPDFIGGLRDPGQVYADALAFQEQGSSNAGAYVRILISPWLVALFPLVAFFWGRLSASTRSLSIFVMAVVILMAISTGQRRDIADLMMTIPFIVIAAHWTGATRFSRRAIITSAAGLSVVVVAFTAFFVYSNVSRVGLNSATNGVNPATLQRPDVDNPMLKSLPSEAQPGFIAVMNYATTGYYGLALALDRDVEPMWGFGHSMFLTRNVEKFTGNSGFENRSLPVQISEKDGFKYGVLWCTAYPYFANDLGWLGTVLLMFCFGRVMASSWIDVLGGKNPYAVVFFSLITILVYYLPATNRMLQDGEGVGAFYPWLAVLLIHRFRPSLL